MPSLPIYERSFASHEKAQFWHLTKNKQLQPKNVFKSSSKKYWFTCGYCRHDFYSPLDSIISGSWCPYCSNPPKKLCDDINCQHCLNKSFASHEKAQFWHLTKNKQLQPKNVFKSSSKKYWFTCGYCRHDFYSPLDMIIRGSWCPYCSNKKLCDNDCQYCLNKSFASHEKVKFWHPTKNNQLQPRDVFKNTKQKCWFKCGDCSHDFDSQLLNVNYGYWCPYCSNPPQKLCDDINCQHCLNKSFASHEKVQYWHATKNGILVPRDVFKQSNKKRWFKCGDCSHDFDSILGDVVRGQWCPFCSSKKLCSDINCQHCLNKSFASHEKAQSWHATKNGTLIPRYVFKSSDKKCWFTCDDCSNDFNSTLGHIVGGRWCPTCVLKTEKKFNNYLTNSKYVLCYIKFIHKFKPAWANLKKTHGTFYEYDFYIEFENDLKIIVEIDGAQHYQQVSNWASPLHNQIRDYIKEKLATNEEINIIRLKQEDVFNDKNDWQNKFENLVTRKKADNEEIEIIQEYNIL